MNRIHTGIDQLKKNKVIEKTQLVSVTSQQSNSSNPNVLTDGFGRRPKTLRISLTDLCNLKCVYCNPTGMKDRVAKEDRLSDEEILRFASVAANCGVEKIRLTGGEPLLRKNIVNLVKKMSSIPRIKTIAMTTNGVLLAPLAKDLLSAGLESINISIDSLSAKTYEYITGGDRLDAVRAGIAKVLALGYKTVKLNVVLIPGVNEADISALAALTVNHPIHVRFCEQMVCGTSESNSQAMKFTCSEALEAIKAELGPLDSFHGEDQEGVAKMSRIKGAKGLIGMINGAQGHLCSSCSRIRLTAKGVIRPCLFSDQEIDVKPVLRSGASDHAIEEALRTAVMTKPNNHVGTGVRINAPMNIIGG